MTERGRVVTAKLDDELVERLDAVSERLDRSKSWIIREALEQWLADDQRRHELTLDALASVDAGRITDQADVEARFDARWKKRRKATAAA